MNYINGLVAPVPNDKKEQYRQHSLKAAEILKEYGAITVVDCWGDDVPEGKLTSFPMAVQLQENETVVFSWITWPSKQAQEVGMDKFMADPRVASLDMPFDGKRMIFGGFSVLVHV